MGPKQPRANFFRSPREDFARALRACWSRAPEPVTLARMTTNTIRLTSLAHGGGCGCKLAPSVLQELLAGQPATAIYKQLLVGTETSDDAAVWQVDDNTCVIATT